MISSLVRVRHGRHPLRNRNLRAGIIFFAFALPITATAPGIPRADRPQTAELQALATARTLADGGDYEGALRTYHSALPHLPAGSPARAEVLDAMSAIETDLGDYDAAVKHATEAAGLHRLRSNGGRATASSLNQAGLAHLYAGRYSEAGAQFEAALALSTSLDDREARVEHLTNLGNVAYFTGRYGDAFDRYAAALAVVESNRTASWAARRRQIALVNQATLDQRLGRYRQALASYQSALAGTAELRPAEVAQIHLNAGVVYRRLGDPVKALASYDRALELFARDTNVDGELGALKNRGIALALDLGELEKARETFDSALRLATRADARREALQARLYRAETTLRLAEHEAAASEFTECVREAVAIDSVEDEWKALYGLARSKIATGDAAGAESDLRRAVRTIESIRESIRIPTLRSDFFNDKREVYDQLIALRLEAGANVAELFSLIESGHSRAWRDRLGLTRSVDLPTVQRALPEGTILLDYWTSPAGSAVVSVTNEGASIRRLSPDPQRAVAFNTLLTRAGANWKPMAAELGEQLLPAISREVTHVIVVADGFLSMIPFETLIDGGAPLVTRSAVSYLPTAAMLLRPHQAARTSGAPWTLRMHGFADPLVGSTELDDRAVLAASLTRSDDEVRAIARELGGRSRLFTGAQNRKHHLVSGPPPPILHIATHAFADAGAIEKSRILFSPATTGGPADYLFLKEAYELPLAGTELVVLSACDTERGAMSRGEGVQSFSRAFLAAGAQSTVTTLWRVPDETTAAFMPVFYHHLQRGRSRAEALRLAKLSFLRKEGAAADPHVWAAFVLTGEGTSPISRSLRTRTLVSAAAAACLAIVIAVLLHRRRRH